MSIYTPQEVAQLYDVSTETVRLWSLTGKILAVKTKGGHRRYILNDQPEKLINKQKIIYARVSSKKQEDDLIRQIEFLKDRYPTYTIISDIGSGINFKRKGLQTILEGVIKGTIGEVVVAHRDRLCRFGFELFEILFKETGSILTVVETPHTKDPTIELSEDLMSIVTVFTARYYGTRKYKHKGSNDNSKNSDISESETD
jgi:putative resolvase